jgi:hypothetical protein
MCTSLRRKPRILKNYSERRAFAICERIRPTLPIVHDESTDGHGLHCSSENSDSGVIDTSRGAEQNHAILRIAFAIGYSRRQLLANTVIAAFTRRPDDQDSGYCP